MKKTEMRRQIVIDNVADHLLALGMQRASLRQLAAAAGMSDRMLLHYFVDKEELLTAALTLVATRLVAMLEHSRSEQMPFHALLPYLAGMLKDPHIRPYLRLWLELAALAADEEGTYATIARHICDDFLSWIAAALMVEREADRIPMAALTMATIEGFVLLDTLNYDSLVVSALEGLALQSSV
jgi:AcrR family transcriptional regulator